MRGVRRAREICLVLAACSIHLADALRKAGGLTSRLGGPHTLWEPSAAIRIAGILDASSCVCGSAQIRCLVGCWKTRTAGASGIYHWPANLDCIADDDSTETDELHAAQIVFVITYPIRHLANARREALCVLFAAQCDTTR